MCLSAFQITVGISPIWKVYSSLYIKGSLLCKEQKK